MGDAHRIAAFRRQVDRWTLTAVRDGVASFDALVCALPGVFPPIVSEGLERLLASGAISQSEYERVGVRQPMREPRAVVQAVLPPPHPLDFDWRYSPDTIDLLLARAAAASTHGDTVLLLGTPSLYVAAQQRGIDREFTLIDAGTRTVEVLHDLYPRGNIQHRDVFDASVPRERPTVVLADPPWYDDHVDAFVWTAASCAQRGAHVFLTLPPIGTRPGVRLERSRFTEVARAHGFRGPWIEAGAISYVTPPFETNALSAAGWDDIPATWRRGDLFWLVTNGDAGARPTALGRPARWHERRLGWVRIRVKDSGRITSIDPALRSIIDGDVLPDVSSHHPTREHAAVWTSGNRVFACEAPQVLLITLDALANDMDPATAVARRVRRVLTDAEVEGVEAAADQLRWLARTESRELAAAGWVDRVALTAQTAS